MKTRPKLPFKAKRASESPGLLLWQTTMLWQRHIKTALIPYDITHPQFVIMATLLWFEAHGYGTTQVSIINWTKLDKMTVSKSLKDLSSMELVIRREHENDTRAKAVFLTAKGKKLINKLVPLVEGIDAHFFKPATAKEQQILLQIFNKLVESHD